MWSYLRSIVACLLLQSSLYAVTFNSTLEKIDKNTLQVNLIFDLDPHEVLFKDSISLEVDTPEVRISQWSTDTPSTSYYDAALQETRDIWSNKVFLTLFAIKEHQKIENTPYLNIFFQTNKQKSIAHEIIKLPFKKKSISSVQGKTSHITNTSISKEVHRKKTLLSWRQAWSAKLAHYYLQLEDFIKKSTSLPLRLILAMLLGIFLSLTPCIYPMIPITVGILQGKKRGSMLSNFLLTLTYTAGLSTMFALLGLLASYTGPLYGRLLSQPLFVLILAAFLIYLSLTMLGVCNLSIPRFFNISFTGTRGPFLSAFMIGVASGTFASPCVSPGLILLLSIVATMNSLFLGFLLLFCFGIGLSLPLLIVGTFSASLGMLPRAGLWMIEVKKIFGALLIGAALYYLSNILNFCVILGLLSITLFILGIFYAQTAQKSPSSGIKRFSNMCATILIIGSVLVGVQTYLLVYCSSTTRAAFSLCWKNFYDEALRHAQDEKKLLFIDIGAEYCSMCKLIDASLFAHQVVIEKLPYFAVPLKVDGSSELNKPYATIKHRYRILGFPTFLLINPYTQKIIKQWHSDLYYVKPDAFINELEKTYYEIMVKK